MSLHMGKSKRKKPERLDIILLALLFLLCLLVAVPVLHVLAASFASQLEYETSSLLLIPEVFTLDNYIALFQDGRIWTGFRTTFIYLLIGVPLNIFLTTSLAYGLSRLKFPGGRFFFYVVIVVFLFNGGIIPLYLLMMQLRLINTIWSVIFAHGVNTFYFIIMRTYFTGFPESIIDSAKLDGAGVWSSFFKVIVPLSMPIIATMTLFYSADWWNEWYYGMIFIRSNFFVPLQLVLRSLSTNYLTANTSIIVAMVPIICLIPFLQKYFVKGLIGKNEFNAF